MRHGSRGRDGDSVDAAGALDDQHQALGIGGEAQPMHHFRGREPERPGPHPPVVLVGNDRRHPHHRLLGAGVAEADQAGADQGGVGRVGAAHEEAVLEGVELDRVVVKRTRRVGLDGGVRVTQERDELEEGDERLV